MSDRLSRRLTVILHADVAGSTGLFQVNEIEAHRECIGVFERLSRQVNAYGGVPHEIRGDAMVAEFSRASDAVFAALAHKTRRLIYLSGGQ